MGRIAIIGDNSIEYVNKIITVWNQGDCAVLIDWRIPSEKAIDMMSEAKVKKCYIQSKYYIDFTCCDCQIDFVTYDVKDTQGEMLPANTYERFVESYSDKEAVIIYSSGTTGKAKGIILSHYGINTNADAIIKYMSLDSHDCMYIVKNIFHASALIGELLVALKTRTPLLIAPILVPPRRTFNNINKFKVTTLCLNPTLLQLFADEYDRNMTIDLSSLRNIYVHGAKANLSTCILASKTFSWCHIYYEYGLTEAGPRVTTQKIMGQTIDSVGKAISGVTVNVLDDNGEQVALNQYGIIHVKTPSHYLGYVSGDHKFISKKEGWINTGDVGFFDNNEELHIVGRVDDVININAHKVYPSDVEKLIINNWPVQKCAVVKLEIENEPIIGCLYVGNDIVVSELRKRLSRELAPYEIPRFYVKTDSLPMVTNGKISMVEVRTRLEEYLNKKT